ncbi:type II secretion system protein GspK [Pseudomonas akapageensis]|uniref:type II secretion system protein GspK n=1 Tax=Pseudomonas akapageensis TaxID=2609961 RepID=UPI0014073714|nr:type II secretion system protein GspK [Pseudomonas akapageensis]
MNPDRQTGLALISVLLVMALVLLLVAGMLRSHQLSISSTGQQIRSLQFWHLALAGENLARQRLRRDAEAILATVNLAQPWAGARDIELAPGTLRVHIEDLAGRFNLAALAQQGQVDQITLQRWQRLCQSLGLPLLDVQALSNQMLLDPSQLRLIPGVQGQALQQLRPLVAVLPSEAGLNINTASERVLAVLEGLDAGSARRLHQQRPEQGYESVQRFIADPLVDGLGVRSHGLAVTSRWFRVEVEVNVERQRLYLYSDLELDPQTHNVRVLRRSLSAIGENETDE